MDPSLSDPHHPSHFTPFATFPTSNNPFVSDHDTAPNHPLFGRLPVNHNPFNHVFQPQPQPQAQPQLQTPPSQAANLPPATIPAHLSYSEMICGAITTLNEPDGSSKVAIARYIERTQPILPPAHGALLTHHLKSLKNNGVLTMVKKSYKIAGSSPPQSVAVAATAAGLVAPRSEISPTNTAPLDPASGSASQPQKRGRGRPPKPKPEAPQQQQPINVQPIAQQQQPGPIIAQPISINSNWEQMRLPVASPTQVVGESAKRRPGRPRKDGAVRTVPAAGMAQASGMAVIMKRRGRPPGRRAAGRQRKPKSVSATASVFPFVASGARRRGRPRRAESGGVATVAPVVGETVAVAPGMKRGRGRPPKIGGVMNRLITKPKRGRGRPVGRPRKNTTIWPFSGATGTLEPSYGELKRKLELASEKAKEILDVLKAGISSGDVQAVAQARQELEGLIPMLTVEPRPTEEVKPEEAAPQTEAETQGEEHGQGSGGGEQAHTQPQPEPEPQPQTQTEAEAMQEALF